MPGYHRKEDTYAYICSVWHPDFTYKDIDDLAVQLHISSNYVKQILKEMNLSYLTKSEMLRIKAEKERIDREKYLQEIWCKEPYESRHGVFQLAKILNTDTTTIRNDIKRLGLEEYILSSSELVSRDRANDKEKRKKEQERILKQLFEEYKRTGKQYLYTEIASKYSLPLRFVREDVKKFGYESMIKAYQENSPKSQRIAYYESNREFLRQELNSNKVDSVLINLSTRFGISINQVKRELVETNIVCSFSVVDGDYDSVDTIRKEQSDFYH